MSSCANMEIRTAAKAAHICLWQIAERCGITDSNFSRKLRRELPDSEKDRILSIIRDLEQERKEVS